MNTNLLNILNRIVAEQGEGILADAKRLFPYFSDYAKNEQKEERTAFGRCIEMGAYQELKKTRTPDERLRVKVALATQMNAKTGIARPRCVDALDLLEAVIFKPQPQSPQPQSPPQQAYPPQPQYSPQPLYHPQPQFPPQQANPSKKTKRKVLIIIAAAVAAVIVAVVIITNIRTNNISPWEGYVSFEDFARAAQINDILSGVSLNEQGFYALMGGAFVGSIFEPFINLYIASTGLSTRVELTAEIDLVDDSKLSNKYIVPLELQQNYNYLVRRTGNKGSKTCLALHFDGKRIFGFYIPYSDWIVMEYEEGAFIKY